MADDTATHPTPASPAPADPTPFIRTYAKDVARLTGTAAARVTPAKEAPTPGVQFDAIDESQKQGVRADAAGPERKEDPLMVPREDILSNLTMGASVPPAKRDEILSRLRSRVQAAPAPSAAVPPPPIPQAPVQAPAAPIAVPAQAPVPAPVPAPASAPAPERAFPFWHKEKKEHAEPKDAASNLHTFKSDFADHIDEQKASTFSVLAAQSDAKDLPAPKQAVIATKKSRLPLVLAGIALVVFGIGGLGGAYWLVSSRMPHTTPFTVPSLIFADENIELPIGSPSYAQAMVDISKQPSAHGEVIVTYITSTTKGKQGVLKTPQPGGALIKMVLGGAPDILLRNITDSSTAGVINAGSATAPFFILQATSYERTLAGMLGWEPTMAQDLTVLYPSLLQAASTSTAPYTVTAPHFVDATIANHDVRVLKNGSGQTVFLYGYKDKQTLIIAKDEAAFTALLTRLGAGNGS